MNQWSSQHVLARSSSGKFLFDFVRGSWPLNNLIFVSCKRALAHICQRSQGWVARIGGRVRMGTEKARRNLDAAGRAEQPG
jgi:hypothetical protein